MSEIRKPAIIGSGLLCLDVMPHPTGRFRYAFSTGGTANVMAILRSMGWNVSVLGKIGDDLAGHYVLADLRACGIDTEFVAFSPEINTPIYELHQTDKGHRFTKICPVCEKQYPEYTPVDRETIARFKVKNPEPVDVFYFDKLSPQVVELAREYKKRSALVYFEPNRIEDDNLFRTSVRVADVVKYSSERRLDVEAFTNETTLPLEVETAGKKGVRFRTFTDGRRSDWISVDGCPVERFIDAAGAGDWLSAAIVDALAGKGSGSRPYSRSNLVTILTEGQKLSAKNCAYTGARGLMYETIEMQAGNEYCPYCHELDKRLNFVESSS